MSDTHTLDATWARPPGEAPFDAAQVEAEIARLKALDPADPTTILKMHAAFLLRVGVTAQHWLARGRAQIARDALEHGLIVALEMLQAGERLA